MRDTWSFEQPACCAVKVGHLSEMNFAAWLSMLRLFYKLTTTIAWLSFPSLLSFYAAVHDSAGKLYAAESTEECASFRRG